MNFFSPIAFSLAALLPVIVVMYLLKLRRTEQVVSSVYLWRRMVRDVEANAPWQKLRRNLLLILQLLFLGALILTLARPFTWAEGPGGQAAIVVVDRSASMAAHDVAPTRLDAAKAQARQWVDSLPDDVRVTVIAAGDGAQVLASSSRDRRQVRAAIDRIRVAPTGSDLTAALELASAIAARQPDTEIAILSDGQVTVPQRLALKGYVRYLPLGISGDNQAISALSLRAPSGSDAACCVTAFVQVTNYGDAPAQRRLALYADGQLFNAYDVEIAPGQGRAIVAGDIPAATRVLEARLLEAGPAGGQDVLALDDRAWAVHRPQEPAAVTLVTEGNLFLETALALFPHLQVTAVEPDDFDRQSASVPQADPGSQVPGSAATAQPPNLTIFDAYVPITATLPPGNLLFIAPPRSSSYFSVTGRIEQPVPRAVEADDPLLSHVSLAEVGVLEASRVPLPAWARAVVSGDVVARSGQTSAPLLFAGETEGRRIAVLTFDLRCSDLPLQVAFPLLVANLTGWLAPGTGGDLPSQLAPGAPLLFALPPQVDAVRVTRPDGSLARLAVEGGQAIFADTAQLGVYRAEWQDAAGVPATASFAVNLFSPPESNVRPADLVLGNEGTLSVAGGGEPVGDREADNPGAGVRRARREWWRPLAFAALALLVVEWLVYQRATVAKLVTRFRRQAPGVKRGR
jgi:hypothetical protein